MYKIIYKGNYLIRTKLRWRTKSKRTKEADKTWYRLTGYLDLLKYYINEILTQPKWDIFSLSLYKVCLCCLPKYFYFEEKKWHHFERRPCVLLIDGEVGSGRLISLEPQHSFSSILKSVKMDIFQCLNFDKEIEYSFNAGTPDLTITITGDSASSPFMKSAWIYCAMVVRKKIAETSWAAQIGRRGVFGHQITANRFQIT